MADCRANHDEQAHQLAEKLEKARLSKEAKLHERLAQKKALADQKHLDEEARQLEEKASSEFLEPTKKCISDSFLWSILIFTSIIVNTSFLCHKCCVIHKVGVSPDSSGELSIISCQSRRHNTHF